jgi:hypothetical protein
MHHSWALDSAPFFQHHPFLNFGITPSFKKLFILKKQQQICGYCG